MIRSAMPAVAKTVRMKTLLRSSCIAAALLDGPVAFASTAGCAIPGAVIQWQADYCLFVSETDDLIAAQPCMDRETARVFRNACTAKGHYKQQLCKATIDAGLRSGTVAACVADPGFAGKAVRQNGL